MRLVNKAKSRLFRSILNFKNFENHVDFVSQPAGLPASQPAIRSGCARYRALKITQKQQVIASDLQNCCSKTIFLLRHGDSFVLPYITFFSINWNV